MTEYQKENLERRKMQIKYSSMYYTLPDTYQEKNEAYTKAFHAGKGFIVGYDTFIYRTHGLAGRIQIGENVIIGSHCTIDYSGKLTICDNVVISEGVKVYSHEHDLYKYTRKIEGNAFRCETTIGKNSWIGAGSIILPGVTIGEYCVIGAGSVVTHDVPDYCIFAGNPAKKIGENKEKMTEEGNCK